MKNQRSWPKRVALLALLTVLFTLAACQNEEQLDAEVATLEASAESTEAPPPTQEPTQAPAVEPATEPTSQPETAEVQETEGTEMVEFANDLFSVAHPAGWVVMEHEDGSGLILANSESSLDRYQRGAALESGDQALNISITPAELFQALFIAIEPGASAEELSQVILTKQGAIDRPEAGEAKIVTLEDGREVAIRKAANDGAEGAVALFEIAEGVITLNTLAGYPGEYEGAEVSALAILSSLEFGGTAEALTAAIDPVPPPDFVAQ
jgi:hypothetical protein